MKQKKAIFLFSNSLNDLLPISKRNAPYQIKIKGDQSVKHLFESCGVPHTEVERVIVNGKQVGLKYLVQDGDQVEILSFKPPRRKDHKSESQQRATRFVADNHLGKLAGYLRLLGFDVLYRNDFQDEELADISSKEGRTLLTRDRRLLMRSVINKGYLVRSLQPRRQVEEVAIRFNLFSEISPFGRCVHCNAILDPVKKDQILDRLLPLTRLYFDEFQLCPSCGQLYWKGSHYEHAVEFIQKLKKSIM